VNYFESFNLYDLETNQLNTFLTLTGLVKKISKVYYFVSQLEYVCLDCQQTFKIKINQSDNLGPLQCKNVACLSKMCKKLLSSAVRIPFRKLVISSSHNNIQKLELECEIFGNNILKPQLGKIVRITGLLLSQHIEKTKQNSGFDLLHNYCKVN